GEHRRADRRVRQTQRGAGDPGGGGRGRRNTGELHGNRAGRVEGPVRPPQPPYGSQERVRSRGSPVGWIGFAGEPPLPSGCSQTVASRTVTERTTAAGASHPARQHWGLEGERNGEG